MSLKPPEQFRHPKNLVMIRLNIMLVKRVRTKSLELKPFLLPSYSFRRAGMVHASPQYPDNILFNTFQEDTSPHMRRILIQVPVAVFWLIYQQVPKVTEDLLTAGWSTGTERDPFPALSGDQQSWQQIASLGYCWSGPDLSGWPQRWRKKKIIHFIPDPINNSDLNTNTFQAHLPPEWHLHHIDVTTFISLSVPSCHISKCYFHERRTHTAQSTAGSSHWPLDEKGVTWKTWENCSYSLLCILLKQCCPVELKFTNRENK